MTIFEAPDGTYFVRVGVGRIWFDTLEEAMHAVGDGARIGPVVDPHDDDIDLDAASHGRLPSVRPVLEQGEALDPSMKILKLIGDKQ